MTNDDRTAGDDPLDVLARELRSLRPRAPSTETRRRVETRLRRRPGTRPALLRLAAVAACVVAVAAVRTIGQSHAPLKAPVPALAAPSGGCECRVRFLPVRSAGVDASHPSPLLDPGPRPALRS